MRVWNAIDPSVVMAPTAKVWHYSVVLAGVVLGERVNVGSHCEIGRGSVIGDDSRIGSFTFLPPNTQIGDRVFIGPHVMFCDDEHPKIHAPGDPPYDAQPPVIGDDAVIGAGAVLLPGVHVGARARIGAGAIVTKDVPNDAHVRGEPARTKTLSTASAGRW